VDSVIILASENCTCAECGRKCGTGHDPSCSSYQPKAKDEIRMEAKIVKRCVQFEQIPIYDKDGKLIGYRNGKCIEWEHYEDGPKLLSGHRPNAPRG